MRRKRGTRKGTEPPREETRGGESTDQDTLLRRIRELEAENRDLALENIALRREIERHRPGWGGKERKLSGALAGILSEWRVAFGQERVFARSVVLVFGLLLTLGRHTLTSSFCTLGLDQVDWSGWYRVFSKCRYEPAGLFRPLLARALRRCKQPFFAIALDDSQLKKAGKQIPGCRRLRDPLSPPFHVNLQWSQRFVQASALVGGDGRGPARGIPVGFRLAPPAAKPGKKADAEAWKAYRKAQREQVLGKQAALLLAAQREGLSKLPGGSEKPILVCVDGSLANQEFLRNLPPGTEFIARVRGDAALFEPAGQSGAQRVYGDRLPTPKAIRQEKRGKWTRVKCWAAGRTRMFQVRVLGPVLWQHTTLRRPLRLIVTRPLRYSKNKEQNKLYRKGAYLLTSDLETPIALLLQTYVYRWEIEVDFRDEKTVLGVGEAQVRNPNSVELVPAFQVAAYGALLMASLEAFGSERTDDYMPYPLWRREPGLRPSLNDMQARLRQETLFVPEVPDSSHAPPESEWPSGMGRAACAVLSSRW